LAAKIDRLFDAILSIVNLDQARPPAQLLPGARDGAFPRCVERLNSREFYGFPQAVEGSHFDCGARGGLGKHASES